MSFTIEKQLPWHNILTAAYVGTQARHLPQQMNVNIVPLGTFLTGTIGNSNLSIPVNRAALDASVLKTVQAIPGLQFGRFLRFHRHLELPLCRRR